MERQVGTWRVSWHRLRQLPGSKDVELVREVAAMSLGPDGESPMPEDDVLYAGMLAIVNGGPYNKRDPCLYVSCLSLLFRKIAYSLDELCLLPEDKTLLERVDKVLAQRGVADTLTMKKLTRRGPPIPIPQIPPRYTTQIGFLEPDEVGAAYRCVDSLKLKGCPLAVREVLTQAEYWLQEAARHKEGLVCVLC